MRQAGGRWVLSVASSLLRAGALIPLLPEQKGGLRGLSRAMILARVAQSSDSGHRWFWRGFG